MTSVPRSPADEERALVDWKLRLRQPDILWSQIAPQAPMIGLVCASLGTTYNLRTWNTATGELRQVSDEPGGRVWGDLAADGRHVFYLQDTEGNETGHYVAVPIDGGASKDLTPGMPPYASLPGNFAVADAASRLAFIAASGDRYSLYVIDRARDEVGTARIVHEAASVLTAPLLSADGRVVVCATAERSATLNFSLLAFDASTGEPLGELWDGEGTTVDSPTFARRSGDHRVLVGSNRSGGVRPALWDPSNGDRVDLDVRTLGGDAIPVDWSPRGDVILVCHFHRAEQQLYLVGPELLGPQRLNHAGGSVGYTGRVGSYFSPDAHEVIFRHNSSTAPGQLGAIDLATNRWAPRLSLPMVGPPCQPFRSVTFPSTGGVEIQAWLAVPAGAGSFPVILETHGGPDAVELDVWLPDRQAWIDRGFAYLAINYRGSTTFGKEFQEQIWGQPGYWELEDMAAARAWLIGAGIARPNAIFLAGWSYGGYLTLQALGRQPKLWAGGMAAVAIADWRIVYEDSSPALRGYCRGLFGGTPAERPDEYSESSPISYAEAVRSPVLIIQGRGDTRTPPRSVETYEARMRALGKPIEVEWFDTGHLGSSDVDLSIRHAELMLDFASRALAATDL